MAKGLCGVQVSKMPANSLSRFCKANHWPGSITESAINTSLENPEIL